MSTNFAKIALGQNFKPQPTSSIASPSNGDIYYDSTRNTFVHYINGNWRDEQSRSDVASAANLTSTQFTASIVQSSFVRITGSTAGNICGLTAGSAAKYVILYNQSSVTQTVVNQSATETTAANRIFTPGSINITLTSGQSVLLSYDDSQSGWVVVSTPGSGGGSGSGKNYLSQYTASTSSNTPNTGNGNFELGSTTGWTLAQTATSSNLPTTVSVPGGAYAGNLYIFTVASSSVTAGATYTNNSQTFTVTTTTTSLTLLTCTGTGSPSGSGTLTKTGGTGPSTIAFSAVQGTQPSGNLSITATSTSIAGGYSGALVSSAASTTGNMLISSAFFIDNEDQAKALTLKLYYQAISGTFNFSGTSSNTFAIYIYDVTNGAWIQPAGVYGMTQSSGVGYATGTFQSTSTSTQYQIALININGTAGSYSLTVDDFSVGPQTAPLGAPMTDWVNSGATIITATTTAPTKGTATITSDNVYWRRVGSDMEVRIEYGQTAAGTATAGSGDYLFQIPNGYSIDTTKLAANSTAFGNAAQLKVSNTVGNAIWNSSTSGEQASGGVFVYDSTRVRAGGTASVFTGNSSLAAIVGSNNTPLTSTNVFIAMTFRVPIVGWSSNVQMSSDTDTRIVNFIGTSASTAFTATSGTTLTANNDTHGGWNGTTYTVPVSGIYITNLGYTVSGATASVWLNGSLYSDFGTSQSTGAGSGCISLGFLSAGATIQLRGTSSFTGTNVTFGIFRLSGPSVVAATESVNARYTTIAGQNLGTSSPTIVNFDTKDYDSHNAVTTGASWIFTVPVSGKYRVSATVGWALEATNHTPTIEIFKNGSVFTISSASVVGNAASIFTANITDTVTCVAGDTLQVKANDSLQASMTSSSGYSRIEIERVGN